ncbi:MAG: SapC family protein [Desulfobulbus sp.]|nr:SapC family protein [Desulfobulbus sp.]
MVKGQAKTKKMSLPQFYRRPMALNAHGHRHAGIKAAPGYGFVRQAMSVPLRISEFSDAVRDYPIVFTDKGTPVPLAIFSYEAGRNLFVGENGVWRTDAYLPLYVRRYPFIGMGRAGADEMALAIDAGSGFFAPRAREDRDLRLFDNEGQLTEISRVGAMLCAAWNDGQNDTTSFVEALGREELLQPGRIELKLADGRTQVVDGFLAVNEQAFRSLPASTVARWHERCWLDLVTLHLASQRNWARLVEMSAPEGPGTPASDPGANDEPLGKESPANDPTREPAGAGWDGDNKHSKRRKRGRT